MRIRLNPNIDELRKKAYPPIGDQLDALWKLLGQTAPQGSSAADLYRQIQAVKQRYPKP